MDYDESNLKTSLYVVNIGLFSKVVLELLVCNVQFTKTYSFGQLVHRINGTAVTNTRLLFNLT